jgi:predicted enzyme related to lactoylglutathione lyase
MVNFRVEIIEKTVAYLRKIWIEIVDEVTTYSYGKFLHILDPEGNAIELREANDEFFSDLMGPTNK